MKTLALVRDQYLNLWDIGNYYGLTRLGVKLLACGTRQADWNGILEYYPEVTPVCYDDLYEVLHRQPDVIDVPDPFYTFSQYFSRRHDRVVVVGWENLPGKNLFSGAAQACLDGAWKCVCRSRLAGHELQFNGVPAGKIKYIPGAIDTEFFQAPDPHQTRDKSVLFVGRITPEKGFLDLLWALHQTGIPLWVAGGEIPLSYNKWLDLLEVDIKLLGFLSRGELRDVYQQAGCLCVPSLPLINDTDPFGQWLEQFGQVFIEAMACGLPVVSTRSGAIPEVVKRAGILVDARDWVALRRAIRQALNPEIAFTKSIMGRANAEKFYDHKVVAQQIINWYELE